MKKSLVVIFALALIFLAAPSFSGEKKALSSGRENEQYKVAAGDKLKITVYQEPDLTGSFEVKEDGTVTFPLLNQVYVKNLTKLEIEQKLSALLGKDYLVNPHVRVAIGSYTTKRRVLLLGHVQKPGTYNFPEGRNLTLLELITEAGGFTGYAAIKGTKIVRTLADDEKVVVDPHIKDIISGRRKDIELETGDLIIVPERLF